VKRKKLGKARLFHELGTRALRNGFVERIAAVCDLCNEIEIPPPRAPLCDLRRPAC
jgi:hypothetical protein